MNVTTYQPTHKRTVIVSVFESDPQNRALCESPGECWWPEKPRCPRHTPMLYTGMARHRA